MRHAHPDNNKAHNAIRECLHSFNWNLKCSIKDNLGCTIQRYRAIKIIIEDQLTEREVYCTKYQLRGSSTSITRR